MHYRREHSSCFLPSALNAVIFRRELPVIRLLTKQGADCEAENSKDIISLFYAVNEGSLCVFRALVEARLRQLNCGRSIAEWVWSQCCGQWWRDCDAPHCGTRI